MENRQEFPVKPEQLEDVNFGAVAVKGPGHGFRLGGTAPSGAPVYHDPEQPASAGRSPAVGVVGDLGCGKSSTAATLVRRLSERGGRAVAVESRSDLSRGLHEAGLADGVGVLRWEGPEKSLRFPVCSAFSPARPGKDAEHFPGTADVLQKELLCGFLRALGSNPAGPPGSGEEARDKAAALRLIVREFVRREPPRSRTCASLLDCFSRFVRDSARSERLRRAARRVRDEVEYWREDPVGAMVLDDEEGTVTPADRYDSVDAPVTIVELEGLPLPTRPSVAAGRLSESEGISRAVLPVVAAWAWRLVAPPTPLAKRVPPAYLMIEDLWRYTVGEHGDEPTNLLLLNYLIREGRSKNVCVGLTSEFYADLEPFGHFLSTLFVGRHRLGRSEASDARTKESARAALGAAGVEASEEMRERLGNFSPGDFLLRDWRGRAGFVHVDSVLR